MKQTDNNTIFEAKNRDVTAYAFDMLIRVVTQHPFKFKVRTRTPEFIILDRKLKNYRLNIGNSEYYPTSFRSYVSIERREFTIKIAAPTKYDQNMDSYWITIAWPEIELINSRKVTGDFSSMIHKITNITLNQINELYIKPEVKTYVIYFNINRTDDIGYLKYLLSTPYHNWMIMNEFENENLPIKEQIIRLAKKYGTRTDYIRACNNLGYLNKVHDLGLEDLVNLI